MTITPIAVSLTEELAQREAFLERTRQQRVGAAQALIRSCSPLTELRLVNVLVPYRTLEGQTHYRKLPTWKEVLV